MVSVQEKVDWLIHELDAAPNARRANRLYERLEAVLRLSLELQAPTILLRCLTELPILHLHMQSVERAVPALRRKYGSDVKIAFGVGFTTELLEHGGFRAVWRHARSAICARRWITRLDAILTTDSGYVELDLDTLTPLGPLRRQRDECRIAYMIDEVRFRDLQKSLESKSVQTLGLHGEVYKSGTKLLLVDKSAEIIRAHGPCDSTYHERINFNVAECNNLSCESIEILCILRCPCKQVRYCSASCQRQHWPIHKQFCTFKSLKSDISVIH